MNIADLRRDYKLAQLSEHGIEADPVTLFQRWLQEAIQAQMPEPNAMTLATVASTPHGFARPSARIVLLKEISQGGFVFYTNYHSRKGQELAGNPFAALLFHWVELERQVRIEGRVESVEAVESDEYFASRPLASRHGAIASPQSQVIESREWLEEAFARAAAAAPDHPPRPPHWGGYRLRPELLEFWQGRRSRLHDRIRYLRDGLDWRIERLAP